MKKTVLKTIETCSLNNIRDIIFALHQNKKIRYLEVILENEIVEEILESLQNPLESYLDNWEVPDEVELYELNYFKTAAYESFFNDIEVYQKELDYFLPFIKNFDKLNEFRDWKQKKKKIEFYKFIEFDTEGFFDFYFKDKDN